MIRGLGHCAFGWCGVAMVTSCAVVWGGEQSHLSNKGEHRLFPIDQLESGWVQFDAEGFKHPVVGVVHRDGRATQGLPLGTIGTGYINLDATGSLGRYTIFNRTLPKQEMNLPFLGLAIEGETYVLSLKQIPGTKGPRQIHYWGHYPIADLEYEMDAPVAVGLRAWSPFLPGDCAGSNVPGVVFQVHLRNAGNVPQRGTLAFSFAGPSKADAMGQFRDRYGRPDRVRRQPLQGELSGVSAQIESKRLLGEWQSFDLILGYALGAIGEEAIRVGGFLGADANRWRNIETTLPEVQADDRGSTVAVDFVLPGGETRQLSFVLAWYAPRWHAQYPDGTYRWVRQYFHRYGSRYADASQVARYLAQHHQALLQRIINWQEVLYRERTLPGWLRDSLINICHIITRNGFWVHVPQPLDGCVRHWYGNDGLFSMGEGSVPAMHAIGNEWLGNLPFAYFFPELLRLNLRGFAYFQRTDGEVPMHLGIGTDMESPMYADWCIDWGKSYVGSYYVHMVDRLWQRTGDETVLEEFYPSVMAVTKMMQTTDRDKDGIPDSNLRWYHGSAELEGTVSGTSGLWLATLRIAERMAQAEGDTEFARDCSTWYQQASRSQEDLLWDDQIGSYSLYFHPGTGARSDIVKPWQLAGQWTTYFQGLPGVIPPERLGRILETLDGLNASLAPFGFFAEVRPEGNGGHTIYPAMHTMIASMVKAYAGKEGSRNRALEPVHQCWRRIVLDEGRTWSVPRGYRISEGWFYDDDYHNLLLWALPAALSGLDIHTFCAKGGLIDRIVEEANGEVPQNVQGR